IEVVQDPNMLTQYINELDSLVGKNKWDVLFTDPDTKDRNGNYLPCKGGYARRTNFSPKNPNRLKVRENISAHFTKLCVRHDSYFMIIRRSGIKKILNFLKTYRIFLPYDMEYFFPN